MSAPDPGPYCLPSTLADLTRLAAMTHNKSTLKVPSSFFFHSQDRRWLLDRQLIYKTGPNYALTARGISTAETLRTTLRDLHP
jgi:hypothetical protein